jgi:hypothetical protein
MNNSSLYTPSFIERFWSKVDKSGPVPDYRPDLGPCWIWTSYLNANGYACIWVGSKTDGSRRLLLSHRVSHETMIGLIPPKYHVDHLCRVRACVNPAHIEAVTHRENIMRGTAPEVTRARAAAQTHCAKGGHEFTPENTYIKPDSGARSCRICRRLDAKKRKGRPIALARIFTPDGCQDVTATHFGVEDGVLHVRFYDELVAAFAPGEWLSAVKERKGIPAPSLLAQVCDEPHHPIIPAA